MAQKDAPEDAPQEPDGPSLELPSLGFRRKKRSRRARPEPAEDLAAPEPATPARAEASPSPEPAPAPAAEGTPAPIGEPVGGRTPLFVEEAPPARPERADAEPDEEPEPGRRARRRPTLPQLGAVPATLVTGLLVGVITVGLVWASQRLCEVLRGTSSCGDAGFLLLLAVLVVAGLLGGSLLKAFGVADGGGTSFLAMGLVAVVLMLVLADQLFAWWMVLAVPGVAMVSYLLAHRLTTAMVDPGGPELHR